MSYYVLKHSAKGTTWGKHKYIRKEGNRYIYPEDIKNTVSNNASDNSDKSSKIDNYLKTLPESSFKTNYEKGISIENISKNDFDTLYKNDPEFKKLADKYYDSEEYDSRAAQAVAEKETHLANAKKTAADEYRAKEEHDSRVAQAAAEKETYLKRAENKKKVENKRDRLEYIRNARKTRNRDKKYVVDTEDGGAFVTRNREKAVQVRNEVKQNKLKREDPIKYYLQRRKQKRK